MTLTLNLLLSIWCVQVIWFAVRIMVPYSRPPDRETYQPQ